MKLNLKLKILIFVVVSTVLLISGCVEKQGKENLKEKKIELTNENLKNAILETIDEIKTYKYLVKGDFNQMIKGENQNIKILVNGEVDKKNKISHINFTICDKFGCAEKNKQGFVISDRFYYYCDTRTRKTLHGRWWTIREYEGIEGSSKISDFWAKTNLIQPFNLKTPEALKEILENSDISSFNETSDYYEVTLYANDKGKEILVKYVLFQPELGYTSSRKNEFEDVCYNIKNSLKELSFIIYVNKKNFAIEKGYIKIISNGIYGKITIELYQDFGNFNEKIDINVPDDIKHDLEK